MAMNHRETAATPRGVFGIGRYRLSFIGLTAFALAIGATSAGAQTPAEEEEVPSVGDLKFPLELIGAGLPSGLIVHGYHGGTFRQSFGYSPGGEDLRRVRKERGATTQAWKMGERTESVGFAITALAVRSGGDEVYIAGIRDSGECIIEKWSYAPRIGGWKVRHPGGGVTTLGLPAPIATPVLSLHGATEWTPPTLQEATLNRSRRDPVYTSPTTLDDQGDEVPSGVLSGLVVDPQGRYLLVFDRATQEILRIDRTQTPNVVTPITNLSTHPSLDLADDMRLREYIGGGRKIVILRELSHIVPLASAGPYLHTVGTDLNNDGTFETWEVLDRAAWSTSAYKDWTNWSPYWRE